MIDFLNLIFQTSNKGDKYVDRTTSTNEVTYTNFKVSEGVVETVYGQAKNLVRTEKKLDYTLNNYPLHMFVNGCVEYGDGTALSASISRYDLDTLVKSNDMDPDPDPDQDPGAGRDAGRDASQESSSRKRQKCNNSDNSLS